jgi:hypothetical protein
MVSHGIIRWSGLFTNMNTIHCHGYRKLEVAPESAKVRRTMEFIYHNKVLLNSLSFLEREAVILKIEGHDDPEESEHPARRRRLHNQYGYLVP